MEINRLPSLLLEVTCTFELAISLQTLWQVKKIKLLRSKQVPTDDGVNAWRFKVVEIVKGTKAGRKQAFEHEDGYRRKN